MVFGTEMFRMSHQNTWGLLQIVGQKLNSSVEFNVAFV